MEPLDPSPPSVVPPPPPSPDPRRAREALLRDPELVLALRTTIRMRVPGWAIGEVLQLTQIAIQTATSLPDDREERLRVCRGIAQRRACDWHRAERKARRVKEEAMHRLDRAVAPAPMEERDLLARAEKLVPYDQLPTFRHLVRHLLGESLVSIALDDGVNYESLVKRVANMKRRLLKILTVLGTFLAFFGVRGPLGDYPGPDSAGAARHRTRSAVSTRHPDEDPFGQARALRQRAFEACSRDEWKACALDLDTARAMDPEGDADPLVQAARADALAGLVAKAGWAPPQVRPYAPRR
jgi:hypothetical protein